MKLQIKPVLKSLLIIVLFVSLFPPVLLSQNSNAESACLKKPDECFQKALLKYQKGDIDQSLIFLNKLQKLKTPSVIREKTGFLLARITDEQNIKLDVAPLGLLEDYRLYYLSNYLVKNRQPKQARKVLLELVEHRYSVWNKDARFNLGLLEFELENYQAAKNILRRFYKKYTDDDRVPVAILTVAKASRRLGQNETKYLRELWIRYPGSEESEAAATRLDKIQKQNNRFQFPTRDDLVARAETYYKNKEYEKAIDIFKQHIKLERAGYERSKLHWGIALYTQREYKNAEKILGWLAKQKRLRSSVYKSTLFYLGKIYFSQQNIKNFRTTASEFNKKFPQSDLVSGFIRMEKVLYEDTGQKKKAKAFLKTQLRLPNREAAATALWELGWLAYTGANYKQAIEYFEKFIKQFDKDSNLRVVYYWQGRAYENTGNPQKALEAFKKICENFTHSFYCHTSLHRISNLKAEESWFSPFINPLDNIPDYSASYSTDIINDKLLADKNFQKFKLLNELDFKENSLKEAELVLKKFKKRKSLLPQLNMILSKAGDYNSVSRNQRIYYQKALVKGDRQKPKIFWEHAYSYGYMPIIQTYLSEKKVDSLFVSSVIREESSYDPKAVSQVGAIGLMQLMPYTGEWVANRIGISFSPDMLYEPEINIQLGSYYLNYLFEKFNGNMIYTIASYNAGPDKVEEWIKNFNGMEMDEFIQSIPYRETRGFVKRVMRSYMEYIRIDNAGDENVMHHIIDTYNRQVGSLLVTDIKKRDS